MIRLFRAPASGRLVRRFLAVSTVAFVAVTSQPARAQAPVGQSSFAQYLSTLTIVAGTGVASDTGDGFAAILATVHNPVSVAYDSKGNLYFCDPGVDVVRRIDTGGTITDFAGTNGVAGTPTGTNGDGGQANAAQLNAPNGIAIDANDNLYIDDTGDDRIREVSGGIINTIINTAGTVKFSNLPETWAATFISSPNGFGIDALGDPLIGDSGANHFVARIASVASQYSYVLAGVGGAGNNVDSADGVLATAATFGGPRNVLSDPKGDYYIVDKTFSRVRLITQDGVIHAFAGFFGGGVGYTGDGGPATAATMDNPSGASPDAFGDLFVAEGANNVIRVIDRATGNISTLYYLVNGVASGAGVLSGPQMIAFGPSGQYAIADQTGHYIRVGNLNSTMPQTAVNSVSTPTNFTLWVNGTTPDTLSAPALNPGAPADFTLGPITAYGAGSCAFPMSPTAAVGCVVPVTFTPTAPGLRFGQLTTTDTVTGANAILPLSGIGMAPAVDFAQGALTTIAGTPGMPGAVNAPLGMAMDSAGNLYFASGSSNTVNKVAPNGTVTIVAGTGTAGGPSPSTVTDGPAISAPLSNPTAVAIDPSGNILIADTGNNLIREVSAENGVMNTISFATYNGNLVAGGSGTLTTPATILNGPKGIATGPNGNIYIADTGNNVVRKQNRASGTLTIVAGNGTAGYNGDGLAATTEELSGPTGLTLDSAGNLYISDTGNNRVREVAVGTGLMTTVAGGGSGSADGIPATQSSLSAPTAVAVDAAGNLYISSAGSGRVRRVAASNGNITTVAGTGTNGTAVADGAPGPSSPLSSPSGVVLGPLGNVYIADTGNSRIAKVTQTTTTVNFGSVEATHTSAVETVTVRNFGNTPLTFSNFTTGGDFAVVTGTSNDCSPGTPLAPGASCLIGLTFTPAATGPVTGLLSVADNSLNDATAAQPITLTGLGSPPPGSIVVSSGSGQTTNPFGQYGQPLTVLVDNTLGAPISGVPVSFTTPTTGVTGNFGGPTTTIATTDSTGTASVLLDAGGTVGNLKVTASVSGVATPAVFSETIAGLPSPVVTGSATPATTPVTYGSTLKLTGTVTPPGTLTTAPTGTVTILDGTATVYSAQLSGGNSVSSPTFMPTAGTHSYTVVYAGDSNYAAGTSAPVVITVNPLPITATVNPATVTFGAVIPTLTGSLTGVLPADKSNVSSVFTAVTSSGGAVTAGTSVGTYSITTTLTGSAAANYTVSATSGTLVITQESTSTTMVNSYDYVGPTSTLLLTATVTPQNANAAETGTVTFEDTSNGNAVVATPKLSGETATPVTAPVLAIGTHTIIAVYSGDLNNLPSTSAPVTIHIVAPDFSISAVPNVTVIQGQVGLVPFSLTAVGSLSSPISLSCTGLPVNTTCVFTPESVTSGVPTPKAPTTSPTTAVLLSVQTSGPGYMAMNHPGSTGRDDVLFAGLFGLPILGIVALRRRRSWLMRGLLAVFVACGVAHLSGCSSTTMKPLVANYTPLGTSTITVTATAATATPITYTASFQLVVVKKS